MPKYFFHMATKDQQVTDKHGRTLDSLSDAHMHAVGLIYRSCAHLQPKDIEGWMINVADASGRVLLAVLFPRRYVSRTWRSYFTPPTLFDRAVRSSGGQSD
jgi:Domain of unknown function (DUF6894)